MGMAAEPAGAAIPATTKIRNKNQVLIFPFMAKGHTLPLLHLTAALLRRGLAVTLLTTSSNSVFLRRHLPSSTNLHLLPIPFPRSPLLPPSCESTDHLPSPDLYLAFLATTTLLRRSFHDVLRGMSLAGDLPLCVISDFFLPWTLPVCREFGVPRLVFHGMGVFAMAAVKSMVLHQTHLDNGSEELSHLPGMPSQLKFSSSDTPELVSVVVDDITTTAPNPLAEFLREAAEADESSWGVVINSFDELEGNYIPALESFYADEARAWVVGPLSLHPLKESGIGSGERNVFVCNDDDLCMAYLDEKPAGSVVYVSFGTQVHMADAQLDEIFHGLTMSGRDFLWVVRSATWTPPQEEKKRKGLIHQGWAPQSQVLVHAAVGGFVSHCGWNSLLESVAAGVPVLAWPVMAEQPLNAKFAVEEAGVGLRVADGGGVVGRKEVCEGVRELIDGEKGRKARERAAKLKKAATEAVGDGGSSSRCLNELLEELCKF